MAWKEFEEEVAKLFRTAGYQVEQNVEYSGQEFDVIATRRDFGELNSRLAVECKYKTHGSVGNAEAQEFVNAFNASSREHGLTYGIVVSNRGFSRQAYEVAHPHPQIKLMRVSELEHELLGARTYIEAAKANYRSDFTNYIALAAEKIPQDGEATSSTRDIARTCESRLISSRATLTVLLGDFGSGKTTIAEQVHSKLSESCLKGESGVFPLILYLRTLEQHDSEDQFIEAHLKLSSRDFTSERLRAIGKRNRIALILDGFDEVAANASEDERMRLFSKAMRIADRGHSVMLTSRPSYFNNLGELNELMATLVERDYAMVHRLDGQPLRRDREVQEMLDRQQTLALKKLGNRGLPSFPASGTAVFVVRPLTKSDILRFFAPHAATIKRLHRKTPEQVYEFLTGIYDLTDLLTRPLLLDMFVDLLLANQLRLDRPDMQMGPAGLYHLYINFHLTRDWGVRRFLKPAERLAFARAAAVAMLEAGGSLEATYESVWRIVREDEDALDDDRRHLLHSDRDGVVTDVRVCSFMNVTPSGRIEFSHKSFMEYFVAEVIVSGLGRLRTIPLLARPLNYEILYFLGSYALVRGDTRLEIVQHLKHTAFGQPEVYRANLLIALLFSEPNSVGRDFKDIDFARIRIARKSFESCRFENFRLRHALLTRTIFTACTFDGLRIEGEIHDVTLSAVVGDFALPTTSEGLHIERCPHLELRSGFETTIRIQESTWDGSLITIAADAILTDCQVRSSHLRALAGRTIQLRGTMIRDTILGNAEYVKGARRLPRITVENSKLSNLLVLFLRLLRDDYVALEAALRSAVGILVIDDPDRSLQAFWEKDEKGVRRYVGWDASSKVLLMSSEAYDRVDQETVSAMENAYSDLEKGGDRSAKKIAARLLSEALRRADGSRPTSRK